MLRPLPHPHFKSPTNLMTHLIIFPQFLLWMVPGLRPPPRDVGNATGRWGPRCSASPASSSSATCGSAASAACPPRGKSHCAVIGCAPGLAVRRPPFRPRRSCSRFSSSSSLNGSRRPVPMLGRQRDREAAGAAGVMPPNRGAGAKAPPPISANWPRQRLPATSPRVLTRPADNTAARTLSPRRKHPLPGEIKTDHAATGLRLRVVAPPRCSVTTTQRPATNFTSPLSPDNRSGFSASQLSSRLVSASSLPLTVVVRALSLRRVYGIACTRGLVPRYGV